MRGSIDYWRRARDEVRSLLVSPVSGTSDGIVDQEPRASETGREVHSVEDESLLTGEEQIERKLLQASGRMSQKQIVEQSPWSESTVSRKLIQMEEDGLITRMQVGRENVVFLDGHQPDIARRSSRGNPPR